MKVWYLNNSNKEKYFEIQFLETLQARRFEKLLRETIRQAGAECRTPERHLGFKFKGRAYYTVLLRKIAKSIGIEWTYGTYALGQKELNELHTYFEEWQGRYYDAGKKREEWSASGDVEKLRLLESLNFNIHEYEEYLETFDHVKRSYEIDKEEDVMKYIRPYAFFEFQNDRTRYVLKDSDYDAFEYPLRGDIAYIGYSHIGKALWHIVRDDDHVFHEVENQTTMTADFNIIFKPEIDFFETENERLDFEKKQCREMKKLVDDWIEDNDYKGEEQIGIGLIPFGKVINKPTDLKKLLRVEL